VLGIFKPFGQESFGENVVDMKLPKIDLKELDRVQKENKKERLAFLDFYAKWIKNKKFSAKRNKAEAVKMPKK